MEHFDGGMNFTSMEPQEEVHEETIGDADSVLKDVDRLIGDLDLDSKLDGDNLKLDNPDFGTFLFHFLFLSFSFQSKQKQKLFLSSIPPFFLSSLLDGDLFDFDPNG